MTVIKTISVQTAGHLKSLRGYLDRDSEKHRCEAMEGQNLVDVEGWEREMARTRAAYGHDRAGKKGSKPTYLYHQIIAFNPDECSMNGGKVDEAYAMAYAREWARRRYPDQEVAWALHREHCQADGTDRWAVHLAVNRTNLATGRRLDDGASRAKARERAEAIRAMDRERGLSQLVRGERNSRTHARQDSRAEREVREREHMPTLQETREAVEALHIQGPDRERRYEAEARRLVSEMTRNDQMRYWISKCVERVRRLGVAAKERVQAVARELARVGVVMRPASPGRRKDVKHGELLFALKDGPRRRVQEKGGQERGEPAWVSGQSLGDGYDQRELGRKLGIERQRQRGRR